jgi:hypothetical protein
MVRKGSPVRVRQRALQKAPHLGGFLVQADLLIVEGAVGMEPVMEPSV